MAQPVGEGDNRLDVSFSEPEIAVRLNQARTRDPIWAAFGTAAVVVAAAVIQFIGIHRAADTQNRMLAASTKEQLTAIQNSSPTVREPITGNIISPYEGYTAGGAISDAHVVQRGYLCGVSGSVRNLPPTDDLWLMGLRYYRAPGRTGYDPSNVVYSPSEYPMVFAGQPKVTRQGVSGRWLISTSQGGSTCPGAYYFGSDLTKLGAKIDSSAPAFRQAIFLVAMARSDSGTVRQYNIAKAKNRYPGIKLPRSSQILDEVDVAQCGVGLSRPNCLNLLPR